LGRFNFPLAYILPNLFTASSAFVGIISIIASAKGNFERAGWLIILSLILDGLDGRIARLTNTTSKFGVEFDSLADIIAFGVAPSMLFYFCCADEFGKFGSLVAAVFVVFGAIRLARFNIMSPQSEPSVFIGVPIPTAAVFVATWVLLFNKYSFLLRFKLFLLGAVLVCAFLMVSNIRYPSFKKIELKKPNTIKILILLIVTFSFLYLYPVEMIAAAITFYLLYGFCRAAFFLLKKKVFFSKPADKTKI